MPAPAGAARRSERTGEAQALMVFRRRPRTDPSASAGGEHESVPAGAAEAGAADAQEPSVTGTYLTDGRSLFRVQHAITEADGVHLDEPLLELEDCATLELILCSADALERLGLRAVCPAGAGGEPPPVHALS